MDFPLSKQLKTILYLYNEKIKSIVTKISFGGIPNSSSIDIFVPYASFEYMGAFLRNGFTHVDNVIPMVKTITWLLLSRLQGNKPHRNSPEPSEPQHTPELSGTRLGNLHQHTPELSGTFQDLRDFRNLPQPASGTYASIHRNPPEPPTGTCSGDPHRHTPELIWAEDPISLRCWGKKDWGPLIDRGYWHPVY